MIRRGDKCGQFYLLAAIVIIALIVGFISFTNYSQRDENTRVKDLSEELKVEIIKFLERGAASGSYPYDDFTKNFSLYSGKSIEIIYAVGDFNVHEAFRYNELGTKEVVTSSYDVGTDIYTVNYGEVERNFQFRQGQNFYYILIQYINGEKYVATNE